MKQTKMRFLKLISAFIVLAFLNSVSGYSQENFKPGFIVDNNKDTIKGLIDYRNWAITPKKFKFKIQSNSETKVYSSTDILSFGVAGEIYTSGIVIVEDGPLNSMDHDNLWQFHERIDTTYLQVLVDGPKSLYYLEDENQKIHFFIGQSGKFDRLMFKVYNTKYNNISIEKRDEKYKGQLNIYLQDCSSIQKKISSSEYKKNELIKLFKDYYECKNSEITYHYKVEKNKSEFGLLAGLSFTQLKFIADKEFSYLKKADFPISTNLAFGVFWNILFSRQKDRISFNNEVLYCSYKAVSNNVRSSDNNDIYDITTGSIGCTSIKLNNLLRFKYPVKNTFVFVNGGISNAVTISETNNRRVESHVYSQTNISEREALIDAKKWIPGYLLGFGGVFKKYSCEVRMEKTGGMSNYLALKSPVVSYYFLFGYRF